MLKFTEWLKSEQRAIHAYVALSITIILIALGYPIENDLFADLRAEPIRIINLHMNIAITKSLVMSNRTQIKHLAH